MKRGGAITNTALTNADTSSPTVLAYASTKGAIRSEIAGGR
jgi:hypothetical protein